MTKATARTIATLAAAAIALTTPAAAHAADGSHPAAKAAEAFLHATGHADGKTACSYLTTEAQADFTDGLMSCQRAIAFVYAQVGSAMRRALLTSYVTKVTVSGNTATIADADVHWRAGKPNKDEDPAPVTLVARNGRWLLKDLG